MELTEQHLNFFRELAENENLQKAVQIVKDVYDEERDRGNISKVDPGNPCVPTMLVTLAGYPFCIRDGLERMRDDLDSVIDELSGGTLNNPWL